MKVAKSLSEIKHDNIIGLLGVCQKPVSSVMELCEFDFEPFTADKKASSLDQFLSYMNQEDIFDSFPHIGNVVASDVVRKELEMAFGQKSIVCKLDDLGEARSMCLTSKNRTTAVHRGSLAFMAPELIIKKLSIASAEIDELKLLLCE